MQECRAFPGDQTLTQLVGTAAPCYLPTRERIKGTQVQAGLYSPHSSFKFTLNSLCSPSGIHYPAKGARVRLCALCKGGLEHTHHGHRTSHLFLSLSCRARLHLKGETVSGFVSQTVKAPKARSGGTKQLVHHDGDHEEGVEEHGRKSPSPRQKAQTVEKERGAAV